MILCGQLSEAGLDPEKLRGLLGTKWDFIASLDMEQHRQDATSMLGRAISD